MGSLLNPSQLQAVLSTVSQTVPRMDAGNQAKLAALGHEADVQLRRFMFCLACDVCAGVLAYLIAYLSQPLKNVMCHEFSLGFLLHLWPVTFDLIWT